LLLGRPAVAAEEAAAPAELATFLSTIGMRFCR
jgi:hypothetical protein